MWFNSGSELVAEMSQTDEIYLKTFKFINIKMALILFVY